MCRLIAALILSLLCFGSVFAQGKGVDKNNERVRDTGGSRTAGSNGTKTDTGAGRGMDFGRDKTPEAPPLPNPYRFPARRDAILTAVQQLMRDRKLIVDDAASKPSDGIIVSQPFTFIKGAVVSQGELSRYADLPQSNARGWTRGRYTLTVEVQPIDGTSSNVSVNAKVEGRTDGATGAEWLSLRSSGLAEDEFLSCLVATITGSVPPGRSPNACQP
ncbi:MAG TPA: hypothetical protein VLA93_20595 [Pyrinomonadaceae bacterium]|nr:hypothetical protein [Pyrinomonadaceae bacterium]